MDKADSLDAPDPECDKREKRGPAIPLSKRKDTRKVEIAWIHKGKQVRKRTGGGTRKVDVSRDARKSDLLEIAKKLFFAENSTSKVHLGEVECDILDFKECPLPEDVTISECYDMFKTGILTFYLHTRSCDTLPSPSPSMDAAESDSLPDLGDEYQPSAEAKNNHNDDVLDYMADNFPPSSDERRDDLSHEWYPPMLGIARDPKPVLITVHRGHVLDDLRKLFKTNPDIDFKRDMIQVQVLLPNGDLEQAQDNGGIMRDILSEFWESFYDKCTMGTDLKVPCLRHDYEVADWQSIASVLAMGWLTQGIFPIRLSRNFINCCLYGMEMNSDDQQKLINEFLLFVPVSERSVFEVALTQYEDVDGDELIEALSSHDCKVLATKDTIRNTIWQIAHKELVQEPSFIKDAFFNVLIAYSLKIDLDNIAEKMKPTTKKVVAILDCEDQECQSFKFLKKYIKELDDGKLSTFLRFATASDLMLTDTDQEYHRLTIRMVDSSGLARRPIAHTCGRVLEIPKAYESFPIFRSEFNCILNSQVWVMDIA